MCLILNTISKVVAHILNDRLSSIIDVYLREEQAGFRSGTLAWIHIQTLPISIEQSVEFR